MALLEIIELTKSFGGLIAIKNLSLSVSEGQKFGIIGPNGAGKTTLFNLISGFDNPTKGQILLNDKKISGLKPNQIAGCGIIRTFQSNVLFRHMTVIENLAAACHLYSRRGFWEGLFNLSSFREKEKRCWERSQYILGIVGLNKLKDELVINLPHGYQRALGVGIALAAEPKILLLDEPTTGMNSEEVENILKIINAVWENGVTIMIVEHNMDVVNNLCHRVVTIDFGEKIAEGTPEEIRKNKAVIEAYLGAED